MDRRSFIAAAGGLGAAALTGACCVRGQEITPTVHYPGRDEGHFLREGRKLPPPARVPLRRHRKPAAQNRYLEAPCHRFEEFFALLSDRL